MQLSQICRKNENINDSYFDRHEYINSHDPSVEVNRARTGEVVLMPSILIVRWDDVSIDSISTLFENRGYLVSRMYAVNEEAAKPALESEKYHAIVHTARQSDTIEDKLGDRGSDGTFVDYALIAKDEIDDVHCVVQLKAHASSDLRAYVKSLWAMCCVT